MQSGLMTSEFAYSILSAPSFNQEIMNIMNPRKGFHPSSMTLMIALMAIHLRLLILKKKQDIQGEEQSAFLWEEYHVNDNSDEGEQQVNMIDVCWIEESSEFIKSSSNLVNLHLYYSMETTDLCIVHFRYQGYRKTHYRICFSSFGYL